MLIGSDEFKAFLEKNKLSYKKTSMYDYRWNRYQGIMVPYSGIPYLKKLNGRRKAKAFIKFLPDSHITEYKGIGPVNTVVYRPKLISDMNNWQMDVILEKINCIGDFSTMVGISSLDELQTELDYLYRCVDVVDQVKNNDSIKECINRIKQNELEVQKKIDENNQYKNKIMDFMRNLSKVEEENLL